MNHNDVIKYIKSHFKNMLEDKIKSIEQSIRSNTKKQYKLKNHILHEHCIINSIEEFNKLLSAENEEYMNKNEFDKIDEYMLTVDNDCFNDNIHISDDIKIIPIRIEKINDQPSEDDDYKESPIIGNEIKIISIEKNCYCGYILYEI